MLTYVPQFYLNRWAKLDRKISSFVIMKDGITTKHYKKYSSEIGFQCKLYEEHEILFFKGLDDKIAKIFKRLDNCSFGYNESLQISLEERKYWSIFIAAQLLRVPKVLKKISNNFKNNPKFKEMMGRWSYGSEEENKLIRKQFIQIIKNNRHVSDLNKMQWLFCKVKSNKEIITCDNPLIFEPRQLDHQDCLLLLPLSPDSFALGVNNLKHDIFTLNKCDIVKFINEKIIKNSVERLFASSEDSICEKFLTENLKIKNQI